MGTSHSRAYNHAGEIVTEITESTTARIYCAVDRKLIGQGGEKCCYYALTVNRWDTEVVMLAFCLEHHMEWLQIRNIVCQAGWK